MESPLCGFLDFPVSASSFYIGFLITPLLLSISCIQLGHDPLQLSVYYNHECRYTINMSEVAPLRPRLRGPDSTQTPPHLEEDMVPCTYTQILVLIQTDVTLCTYTDMMSYMYNLLKLDLTHVHFICIIFYSLNITTTTLPQAFSSAFIFIMFPLYKVLCAKLRVLLIISISKK